MARNARGRNSGNGNGNDENGSQPSALDAAQQQFVGTLNEQIQTNMTALADMHKAIGNIVSARQRLVALGVRVEPIPAAFVNYFAESRSPSSRGPASQSGSSRGSQAGSRARGKRFKNDENLVQALQGVLRGKQMSVTEVADAVQEAGYRTTSDNFRTIVNQALIKKGNGFRKVSRGVYTVAR